MADAQQDVYAGFMATLARDLPQSTRFAVWNEPNLNGFWLYQFEAGKDIAAPGVRRRSSRARTTRSRPSHRRSRSRRQPRPARLRRRRHPTAPDPLPDAFIRDMGAAYRASGRTKPIMDVFALHPYQTRSRSRREQPQRARPSGSATTTSSWRSSAQRSTAPRSPARSFRSRTRVRRPVADPAERLGSYTNAESPIGKDAVPEQTQAEYYEQALRARGVPAER